MKLQNSPISYNENPLISMDPESQSPNSTEKAITKKREWSWKVATNLLISFQYAWAGLSYAFFDSAQF